MSFGLRQRRYGVDEFEGSREILETDLSRNPLPVGSQVPSRELLQLNGHLGRSVGQGAPFAGTTSFSCEFFGADESIHGSGQEKLAGFFWREIQITHG